MYHLFTWNNIKPDNFVISNYEIDIYLSILDRNHLYQIMKYPVLNSKFIFCFKLANRFHDTKTIIQFVSIFNIFFFFFTIFLFSNVKWRILSFICLYPTVIEVGQKLPKFCTSSKLAISVPSSISKPSVISSIKLVHALKFTLTFQFSNSNMLGHLITYIDNPCIFTHWLTNMDNLLVDGLLHLMVTIYIFCLEI